MGNAGFISSTAVESPSSSAACCAGMDSRAQRGCLCYGCGRLVLMACWVLRVQRVGVCGAFYDGFWRQNSGGVIAVWSLRERALRASVSKRTCGSSPTPKALRRLALVLRASILSLRFRERRCSRSWVPKTLHWVA